MKRALMHAAVATCAVISFAPTALAAEPDLGVELSAHAAAALPLASWGELSGPLLGAHLMARYEVPVDGLAARLRAGVLFGLPTREITDFDIGGELVLDSRTDIIPLWVGADYATPLENLSAHAEVGLTIVNLYADGRSNGQVLRRTSQRLGFTLDVGASYDLGVARVGLDVTLADVLGESVLPGVMLSVGLPVYTL